MTDLSGAFLEIPIWILGLALFVAMLAASEIGRALFERHKKAAHLSAAGDEFSLTAVLGLLALLIGFTFSLSLQRFDERRVLVVKEANAIGTTWLRMDLLDEAPRESLRALLKRYVAVRVDYGTAPNQKAESDASQLTEQLQQQIWTQVTAAVFPQRTTALAPLVVSTTNDMIDAAGERSASRSSHIPARLLETLALYCLAAAGLIGYQRGRYRVATTLVFLLIVASLAIIVDLDRPATGAVTVSQQPMIDLLKSMGNAP
ncbi:hypothetical protein [Dyella sp. 20L07]|uniref:bestrophin-like domain n=1 Tax=Dyella sp. 20L07 TaxID=3384240 RepID=UPI003D2B58CA